MASTSPAPRPPRQPSASIHDLPLLDHAHFRSKLFWRLLASPWTLLPFLAGFTDLAALWTFNLPSPPAVFAGIACLLGSLGIVATRFLLGSETEARKIYTEIEEETRRAEEARLDDLDQRLVADQDPRTEGCLRDLRALLKTFQEGGLPAGNLNPSSTLDLSTKMDQLFRRCVLSLEKTLELWYTADRMTTTGAKKPILEERERILHDVMDSVRDLGRITAQLQRLGTGEEGQDPELVRIRGDLDQSLAVAKSVEKRMQELEREIGPDRHQERK